jgi:hypothetical protein
MREAVARNPTIELFGLSWSLPGWFTNRTRYGADQAEYTATWVDGVRQFFNGTLHVGGINERREFNLSASYVKVLRSVLDQRGHSDVMIVWPDGDGGQKPYVVVVLSLESVLARGMVGGAQVQPYRSAARAHLHHTTHLERLVSTSCGHCNPNPNP